MKALSYCRDCKQPWIPDARHVDTDGRVKSCVPVDNLVYLEYLLGQKEKRNET
jgi:hypothetical protein